VLIDRDHLPREMLERHEEAERAERKKYLDRLSEEARRTAEEREKNFALNYTALVALKDLRMRDVGAPSEKP